MFNLFKKNKTNKINYVVFLTENGKYLSLVNTVIELIKNSKIILIYHFDDTESELIKLLEAAGVEFRKNLNESFSSASVILLNSEEMLNSTQKLETYNICFVELHPDLIFQQSLMSKLAQNGKQGDIKCYTEIDNSFFELLGNNRLKELVKSMGVSETESMSHTMIDKSIHSFQKKLQEKLDVVQNNRKSIDEWIKVNPIS